MTYDEMQAYCEGNREADGFCWVSSACSGPSMSNLAHDFPMPQGIVVYRGGNHGSCRFEVSKVGSTTVGIVKEEE